MVLSPIRHSERPQPIRFTGLGLALAVNLMALLFLSLPRDAPLAPPAKPASEPEPIIWITPELKAEPLPVPEMPVPPQRPIERSPRVDAVAPPSPPVIDLPPTHRYTIDPTPPGGGSETFALRITAPPTQVALLVAPRPPYPAALLRQGVQGTVTLKVHVGIDGRPLAVDVETSSGHRALDRHAREHVLQRWRFEPARLDGRPVEALALIPIDFVIPR